jgi:hypothetical protein
MESRRIALTLDRFSRAPTPPQHPSFSQCRASPGTSSPCRRCRPMASRVYRAARPGEVALRQPSSVGYERRGTGQRYHHQRGGYRDSLVVRRPFGARWCVAPCRSAIPTARGPEPKGAAGFAFGEAAEARKKTCEVAGQTWTQVGHSRQCSARRGRWAPGGIDNLRYCVAARVSEETRAHRLTRSDRRTDFAPNAGSARANADLDGRGEMRGAARSLLCHGECSPIP